MNALIWRLHFKQVYFAVAALVVLAVVLLVTGINMANDYHAFFASCATTNSCGEASGVLFRGDGAIMDVVDGTLVVPLLLGLFWGAPMLAKEYEDGTHNLAWTQGVTRRRWLSTNILWVFAAAAAWAGAMAALVSWWHGPENALGSRFETFDLQGVVPIAYAIFAVALGIAAGSVIRRVLPALAVTLATFVGLRAAVGFYLRPHYLEPVVKRLPFMTAKIGPPAGSWIISSGLVGPGGRQLGNSISIDDVPAACRTAFLGNKGVTAQCLASHGFGQFVTFQPAGRFWAFQGIEAAIFLAIAAVLVALTYRVVLARDA